MYFASLSAQKRLLLEAIEHTSKKLKEATICNEPFEHYIIDEFLHPEIFKNVNIFARDQQNLSTPILPEGRKSIDISQMDPNEETLTTEISAVPKFFQSLELKVQFTDFMKKHINSASWGSRGAHVSVTYCEDSPNYQLPPHADSPQKLITCLIYCGDGEESTNLGTSLFRPKDDFHADPEIYRWYDFLHFDEIKRVPYKPNTALLFSPSDISFHGVVNEGALESRKVLQYQVCTNKYIQKEIVISKNESLLKNNLVRNSAEYRRNKPRQSFEYGDLEIKFSLPNEICVQKASSLLSKEPETIQWINSFEKDEVFFDIGANIGVYSLWAAMHRSCRVFSFEPEASNYAVLNENIQANNAHDRVVAFCMAISDTNGIGQMRLFDSHAGKSGHQFYSGRKRTSPNEPNPAVQGIYSSRLDDLITNLKLPCPNHVKIDVDGIEPLIISGGLDVLGRGEVKSVMIEVDMKNFEHLRMLDSLQKSGFRSLSSLITKASNKHKGVRYNSNFLFVREEFLKKMKVDALSELSAATRA